MERIAVIIPAHNEETVILDTLGALQTAGFSKDDIYVVDDKSTDKTNQLVKRSGVHLRTLTTNLGKAAALKELIRYFMLCERYDWITFLDADTEVTLDFRSSIIDAIIDDPSVGLYVGQVVSKKGGYITALRAVEYAIGHDLFKSGMSRQGVIFVAPGCASIYRSDVLQKLRFESDTLAEDMDLTMQVQRLHERVVYLPGVKVVTQDPLTIKDYTKQVTRWLRGGWQVLKKYRTLGITKKQKVDLWIIFLMLDSLIFNRIIWFLIALFVLPINQIGLLLLVDMAMYFAFAIYAAIKNKRPDVVYKFPLYFWASYINPFIFFKTFMEVMVFNKQLLSWNKVQRY